MTLKNVTGITLSSTKIHMLYGDVKSLLTLDIMGDFFLTLGKVRIMAAKTGNIVYETNHILHSFHGGF